MYRSRSARVLLGAALTIGLGLSLEILHAQRPEPVRTVKDFPNRLSKESQPQLVPQDGNRVRTADDFRRAREERARLASDTQGSDESSVQTNLTGSDTAEPETDSTRYVFSIPGRDVVQVAAKAGAVFSPRGGKPQKQGGMAAFQMAVHPHVMTSYANGHLMTQVQPSVFWVIESSSNHFYMFATAKGQPLRLRKGWSVVEVVLKGKNYRWLTRPQPGSTSPFFSVELTAYHHADTVVEIAGIRLEGPPGVQDWKQAFLAPNDSKVASQNTRTKAAR